MSKERFTKFQIERMDAALNALPYLMETPNDRRLIQMILKNLNANEEPKELTDIPIRPIQPIGRFSFSERTVKNPKTASPGAQFFKMYFLSNQNELPSDDYRRNILNNQFYIGDMCLKPIVFEIKDFPEYGSINFSRAINTLFAEDIGIASTISECTMETFRKTTYPGPVKGVTPIPVFILELDEDPERTREILSDLTPNFHAFKFLYEKDAPNHLPIIFISGNDKLHEEFFKWFRDDDDNFLILHGEKSLPTQ